MHHESSIQADTPASPVVFPPPSSATMLATQSWQPAAQPTEPAQIANGLDSGEAPQSRKRLLTSTAPPILVGLCPVPLAAHSDTSAPNQEYGIPPSPQQEPPMASKRRRRSRAVEDAETDALPTPSPTRHDPTVAEASPVPQRGISWPRPRMQVGWEREGERKGADAPACQTLCVYLLPNEEQAYTSVRVCLSNQTGNVAVLRADRTESGCYMVDLATIDERLGQPSLPIAARVRSPDGSLLCMALLHLQPGTPAATALDLNLTLTAHSLSSSLSPSPPFPAHRSTPYGWTVRRGAWRQEAQGH